MIRFLSVVVCLAATSPAFAQIVAIIPTEAPVSAVVQTPRGSYVETERGTYRLETGDCEGGICLTSDVIRGLPERAPEGALPDGFVAVSDTGDIRKAWYGQPTDRYAHGVLGDAIEGGSLVAVLVDGTRQEFVLPEAQVFEDITPRIADLDFDGTNEIVTIRSSQTGGSAVVIYGIRGSELVEVGASPENGQANRWLNIAGMVDFSATDPAGGDGDKHVKIIAAVRTPHIGGRLFSLFPEGDGFTGQEALVIGVSNHVIGSRELGMSVVVPVGNDFELYIPAQNRQTLIATLGLGSNIPLPGPIDKAIIALDNHLVTATEDGRLLAIKP